MPPNRTLSDKLRMAEKAQKVISEADDLCRHHKNKNKKIKKLKLHVITFEINKEIKQCYVAMWLLDRFALRKTLAKRFSGDI